MLKMCHGVVTDKLAEQLYLSSTNRWSYDVLCVKIDRTLC
jgi:hypothetical protein